jgi:hypothetical protein
MAEKLMHLVFHDNRRTLRTAVNKVKLANMIANVWNRSAHEEEEERKHLNCQSKVLTL